MKIWITEIKQKIGESVTLFGWVHARRDHGKIIFIDLRDRSGIAQLVFTPKSKDLYELANTLRDEWVIQVRGVIAERPKNMRNSELETGNVEVQVSHLTVLNKSKPLPFDLNGEGYDIGEEHRMQYRYLDLRRARMQKNIRLRHAVNQFIRNWLSERGFYEVETPILTKSTPEGARDYVVPSRLYPNKFYALPQSPQQYKQLIMTGGIERYFQIARCFRDEDTRKDRQPEFTQMDLEMSFVEREDVMELNERLLIALIQTMYPHKTIQEIPFPRLTYEESMKKFNSDRPDLRTDKKDPDVLAFCWITDFPFFEKDALGHWTFTHNPFSAPKPEYFDNLLQKKNIENILTSQYDVVMNGEEIGGGSIRNHHADALMSVFEIIGFEKREVERDFGHMLEAFRYGAPPHGGIAWGLDRLMATLNNEPNIREVIAFPKTGDARGLMMDSPSQIGEDQLRELNLKKSKQQKE